MILSRILDGNICPSSWAGLSMFYNGGIRELADYSCSNSDSNNCPPN